MKKTDFDNLPEKDRLSRTLEGVAFYANVHTPNTTSVKKFNGQPYYIVNLGLEEKEIAKAKAWGLEIFEPTENITMPYVKLKRKPTREKTIEEVRPDVVDTAQNAVPANILIGNGSKVRCRFATYWYDNNGGGIGTALYKVQIVSLVPFKPRDSDFVSDGSGFTVDSNSVAQDDFADDLPWDRPQETASARSGIFE